MSSTSRRRTGAERWHYEDIAVGAEVALGDISVTRSDIVEYARVFDPQPFHLDEEAARSSMVGQLCASGWHSCALLMRLFCDGFLLDAASLGSPGMDEVKWLRPVLPDMRYSARMRCVSKRPLASRPGIGMCKMQLEMSGSDGTAVMTWLSSQMFEMREPPAASAGDAGR